MRVIEKRDWRFLRELAVRWTSW